MNSSEVLYKAADLIIERGHGRNSYVSADGSVCAVGAIRIVCGGEVVTTSAYPSGFTVSDRGRTDWSEVNSALRELRHYLVETGEWTPEEDSLPMWNDRNDAQHVIAALRSAAELAKPAVKAQPKDDGYEGGF